MDVVCLRKIDTNGWFDIWFYMLGDKIIREKRGKLIIRDLQSGEEKILPIHNKIIVDMFIHDGCFYTACNKGVIKISRIDAMGSAVNIKSINHGIGISLFTKYKDYIYVGSHDVGVDVYDLAGNYIQRLLDCRGWIDNLMIWDDILYIC